MRIQTSIGEVQVDFRHGGMYTKSSDSKNYTECTITGQIGSVSALAECAPSDNFCRETGRKLSLTRALQRAGAGKQLRREIWKGYFARKQKPVAAEA